MNKKKAAFTVVFILLLLLAGVLVGRLSTALSGHADHGSENGVTDVPAEYTCSMHPQVRQPNPGKCPICAMDLILAVQVKTGDDHPRRVTLSSHAKALARIQTSPVKRGVAKSQIRLLGHIEPDESRERAVSARFPARVEQLYINYSGQLVRPDDHLAALYSPELLTAQVELLSAIRFNDEAATRAARGKLSLWGLSESTIQSIEQQTEPRDTINIDSPIEGYVTEKRINEGDYVDTGQVMLRITDLSTVWVILNAYETDKPSLRIGQPVTFTTPALPGKTFEARIAFIPPFLDETTRTFRVRVSVPNPDLSLRPGMFVTAVVEARVTSSVSSIDASLAGKWISPMHPEIVKDGPGVCDVCGMDLIPIEAYGSIGDADEDSLLLVPSSAILQTGKRAIAYVEVPDIEQPTYEGREIVVGARAGDFFVVESGLQEGERVVTHGAFKIDSTLQLHAKPGMMSLVDDDRVTTVEIQSSGQMRRALAQVLDAYFPLWHSLAMDDLSSASDAAGKLASLARDQLDSSGEVEAQAYYKKTLEHMARFSASVAAATDLGQARVDFEHVSNTLIDAVRVIGLEEGVEVHLAFCPMTFEGRRSDWLQNNQQLLNPYFGAKMLKCGDFDELELPVRNPQPKPGIPPGHQH